MSQRAFQPIFTCWIGRSSSEEFSEQHTSGRTHKEKNTRSLLEAVSAFLSTKVKPEATDRYLHISPQNWNETGKPTLDPCVEALRKDRIRMPIAVNCGTSGSGKTVQLKLAMQHFEKSRGKALYITFNGGVIERGGNAITASSQACDEDEIPEIRVYMRILYSAVCRHGIDDAGSFSDIAAVVVPHLKAIKRNRAIDVVRACRAILELKPEENILIAAGELATLGKEAAVCEVSKKLCVD
ncbi:hypothetical protein EMCRGX_G029962 [Ephydatia muelleri]